MQLLSKRFHQTCLIVSVVSGLIIQNCSPDEDQLVHSAPAILVFGFQPPHLIIAVPSHIIPLQDLATQDVQQSLS